MTCEKCWSDAGGNAERYLELLAERRETPCTPREQAGVFWSEREQRDGRPAGLPGPRGHS